MATYRAIKANVKTLGELLDTLQAVVRCVEGIEAAAAAKDESLRQREEAAYQALLEGIKGYQNRPGVPEVRLLCGRYGTELRHESVLKLRHDYCELTGRTIDQANATHLSEFAAAFKPKPARWRRDDDGDSGESAYQRYYANRADVAFDLPAISAAAKQLAAIIPKRCPIVGRAFPFHRRDVWAMSEVGAAAGALQVRLDYSNAMPAKMALHINALAAYGHPQRAAVVPLQRLWNAFYNEVGPALDKANAAGFGELAEFEQRTIDAIIAAAADLDEVIANMTPPATEPLDHEPPATGGNEQDGAAVEQFIFAPSGDGYFIKGFDESGYVKDMVGFHHIAKLVAQPGTPILMTELLGAGDAATDRHSRQPAMTAEAKRKVWERLQELQEESDDAKADNDPARQERAMEERERLMDELKTATGVLRKDRDINSQVDKNRPRILGAVKRACDALRKSTPPMIELANHFQAGISADGPTVVYRAATAIVWCDRQ